MTTPQNTKADWMAGTLSAAKSKHSRKWWLCARVTQWHSKVQWKPNEGQRLDWVIIVRSWHFWQTHSPTGESEPFIIQSDIVNSRYSREETVLRCGLGYVPPSLKNISSLIHPVPYFLTVNIIAWPSLTRATPCISFLEYTGWCNSPSCILKCWPLLVGQWNRAVYFRALSPHWYHSTATVVHTLWIKTDSCDWWCQHILWKPCMCNSTKCSLLWWWKNQH